MKFLKVKIVLVLVAAVFLIFFFDDYDIIDVEKTAIITAVAIDIENGEGVSPSESVSDGTSGEGGTSGSDAENGGEANGANNQDGNSTSGDSSEKNSAGNKTERYIVTAQIAVPEATDTNSENTRTELSGSGGTIGAAIKAIGDVSGWYPHLSFCNLIILGSSMAETNVIKTLDYFSKTLRLQDSAMVVLAKDTAKELLEITTPLDKISSFAIQKVLFKTKGFDADVASTDVKDFCLHYYDVGSSSFMPIVGAESQFPENSGGSGGSESGGSSGGSSGGAEEEGGSSGGSGGSGSSGGSGAGRAAGAEEKKVFSAFATALFKEGRKVGELTPEQTLAFNAIRQNVTGTTIELDGVKVGFEKPRNFLLTIIKNKHSFNVRADENGVTASVNLTLYCKISDRNAEASDSSFSKNVPLPPEVIKAAEEKFTSAIKELIETEKQTECDFLRIKRELFRKNYKYFARFKDSYLSHLTENITVTVTGQK